MKKTVSALSPARSKSHDPALPSAGVCGLARSPLIEGGVDRSQLQDTASKLAKPTAATSWVNLLLRIRDRATSWAPPRHLAITVGASSIWPGHRRDAVIRHIDRTRNHGPYLGPDQ